MITNILWFYKGLAKKTGIFLGHPNVTIVKDIESAIDKLDEYYS